MLKFQHNILIKTHRNLQFFCQKTNRRIL